MKIRVFPPWKGQWLSISHWEGGGGVTRFKRTPTSYLPQQLLIKTNKETKYTSLNFFYTFAMYLALLFFISLCMNSYLVPTWTKKIFFRNLLKVINFNVIIKRLSQRFFFHHFSHVKLYKIFEKKSIFQNTLLLYTWKKKQ